MDNITCINCNKRGHCVKNCYEPITSFGVIAIKKFTPDDEIKFRVNPELSYILSLKSVSKYVPNMKNNKDIRLLMIQRKDTIGFTDFIRGKYNASNLKVYFTEMTQEEQYRIKTESFEDLWNKLWINHRCKTFRNEYENAKSKFEKVNIGYYTRVFPSKYNFQEFGFPKGRKNGRESNLACAQREFSEETGYTSKDYTVLDNEPVTEEFIGTDNVCYRHVYYIVLVKECDPPRVDPLNKTQIGEVKNIGWLSFNDCFNVIRSYDTAKKCLVRHVYELCEKKYNDVINDVTEKK